MSEATVVSDAIMASSNNEISFPANGGHGWDRLKNHGCYLLTRTSRLHGGMP